MILRQIWLDKIYAAWKKRSIVWLAGVRRSGKTTLCKSIDNIAYFDCDLPEVRKDLSNPTAFLSSVKSNILAFDEVHRLKDPSQFLKIAADHYPEKRIIATGSSTLHAIKKFSDTLTGRKIEVHLTPLLVEEGALFGMVDLDHRFLFGGLPPFFLSKELPDYEYQEWMTSFWAKDIQTLFRVANRDSFLKFTELLLAQSGSSFEASRFTDVCEVSRPTIVNYLKILETSYIARVLRPFTGRNTAGEIKSAPKVYGFDTGFICHMRHWKSLKGSDYGPFWEHLVLNELIGQLQYAKICYWRTKYGHEIDFVILKDRDEAPIAIECKWTFRSFSPENFKAFRKLYPKGMNYVVVSDIDGILERKYDDITVQFMPIADLAKTLA